MPTVFVIAEDWLLRAGVRAELREQGVEALGMESASDASRALAAGEMPSALVLDAGSRAARDPAIQQLARRVPTVVIASRTEPSKLPSGAKVLYRPVRVGDVVAMVRELLQGYPAQQP